MAYSAPHSAISTTRPAPARLLWDPAIPPPERGQPRSVTPPSHRERISVWIGTLSSAAFANSTAIGNGASTTRANQQSFGTATNTYTMAGLKSAASLAAQTGPVRVVTTDATAIWQPRHSRASRISSGLQSSVSALQGQIRQAFEGTAIAIAMGGGALPTTRSSRSQPTGAPSAAKTPWPHRPCALSQNVVFNGGIAAGFQQGGVGGRAGVTYAW